MVPLLQELNTNIAELVDKTRGSLVQITNGGGTGAGTIWPGGAVHWLTGQMADRACLLW